MTKRLFHHYLIVNMYKLRLFDIRDSLIVEVLREKFKINFPVFFRTIKIITNIMCF